MFVIVSDVHLDKPQVSLRDDHSSRSPCPTFSDLSIRRRVFRTTPVRGCSVYRGAPLPTSVCLLDAAQVVKEESYHCGQCTASVWSRQASLVLGLGVMCQETVACHTLRLQQFRPIPNAIVYSWLYPHDQPFAGHVISSQLVRARYVSHAMTPRQVMSPCLVMPR